jgi:hypothetical protein
LSDSPDSGIVANDGPEMPAASEAGGRAFDINTHTNTHTQIDIDTHTHVYTHTTHSDEQFVINYLAENQRSIAQCSVVQRSTAQCSME